MKRIIFIVLFLIVIAPFKAGAEELIKKGELLNLERCLELGLKIHPTLVAAAGAVDASRSRVEQAKAIYYPQIDGTAGYSRIAPVYSTNILTSQYTGAAVRSYDQYTGSLALKQNLYDFGKTAAQVKVQQMNLSSSGADLETVISQIIFSIKQAYYSVLQAKRNKGVAEDTVKQFQQHLEQARGFYSAGTKPRFDVTKAEVELSNAKLNLIKAENALRIAGVNLNNAMGFPEAPEYVLEDSLTFKKYEITLEEALARAYSNRPDIKSVAAKKQAAEASVELAKKSFYPALAGSAAYNWGGRSLPLENGWNVGANVSFSIFSGFLTKNQVDEAKANLRVALANEDALKQTVFLETQQACLNLKEAEERIPVAELTVRQALENYDLANGRYAAGVGNPIEVTDAEIVLANAKTAHIQALSDYKVAQASLEKAMGLR